MAELYIYSEDPGLAGELAAWTKDIGLKSALFAFSREEADKLSQAGADRMVCFEGKSPFPFTYAKDAAKQIKEDGAIGLMVSSTVKAREFGAMAAGYLQCPMSSDVSKFIIKEDSITVERLIFGGAVVSEETLYAPAVFTVPSGKYESLSGKITDINFLEAAPDMRITLENTEAIVKQDVSLGEAERIIGIGLGVEKKEDIDMIKELAKALEAELACSRPVAEEKHFLPPERYIGISNNNVSPKLYLAVGISGQVQHVVGVRDAKIIVAINKDENALIFRAADYGIVGDLYEYVPKLTALLL